MPYAESVADLVVAALSGRPAPPDAIRDLDAYRLQKLQTAHVPHSGLEIARQIRELVDRWGPPRTVVAAATVPHGKAADVCLEFDGGQVGWIQVKAQLMKERFGRITEADWDQDFTAALAKLAQDDATFDTLLTPAYRARLGAKVVPVGWSLSDLVIADIYGLPDGVRAAEAGVNTVADLRRFLPHSYFLQVTREGARLIPHSEFACIGAYLAGEQFYYSNLGAGDRALARIWCAWGHRPERCQIHWQYYVYDHLDKDGRHVWGRHKLNDVGVGDPRAAVVIPALP